MYQFFTNIKVQLLLRKPMDADTYTNQEYFYFYSSADYNLPIITGTLGKDEKNRK